MRGPLGVAPAGPEGALMALRRPIPQRRRRRSGARGGLGPATESSDEALDPPNDSPWRREDHQHHQEAVDEVGRVIGYLVLPSAIRGHVEDEFRKPHQDHRSDYGSDEGVSSPQDDADEEGVKYEKRVEKNTYKNS